MEGSDHRRRGGGDFQELMSTSVATAVVPPSGVPDTARMDIAELSAALEKSKASIAELKFADSFTVCRHEGLMEELKKRHTKELDAWKETSLDITERPIKNV